MDEAAKAHWFRHQHDPRGRRAIHFFGEPWSFHIGSSKICKEIPETIYDHARGICALRHWEEKARFGDVGVLSVDWECTGMAMKAAPLTRRHWISKQATGFCGTGKMMQLWKQRSTAECPRCHAPEEDVEHVYRCPNEDATAIWAESIDALLEWMLDNGSCPELARAFCDGLNSWRNDIPPLYDDPRPSFGLLEALEEQSHSGWQAALEGCLSLKWRAVQEGYLRWYRSRKSSRRWTVALIKKLWDVAWDQWEHRNAVLHRQETDRQSLLLRDTDREIRRQYDMGRSTLPRRMHNLLAAPLEELLESAPAVRRQWVASMKEGRARFRRQQRDTYRAERIFLAQWLAGGALYHGG
jgi:hypothetical protein